MAGTKISALASGSPPQSSDEFPIARAGGNFKLTFAQMFASPPAMGGTTPAAVTTTSLVVNTGDRGKFATINGAAGETFYINGFASAILAYNAELSNAGVWTARGTSSSQVALNAGNVTVATDTGLTSGNTFSPTTRYTVDATGLAVVGAVSATGSIKRPPYTVGTLPSAAAFGAGAGVYVTDETGGAVAADSNGAVWKRSGTQTTIS